MGLLGEQRLTEFLLSSSFVSTCTPYLTFALLCFAFCVKSSHQVQFQTLIVVFITVFLCLDEYTFKLVTLEWGMGRINGIKRE